MEEAGRWLWDVRTPMRDGVDLSVDLHLPPAGLGGGPYPAVLIRTAANNQTPPLVKQARALADEGFAVAIQDVRGREDSAGCFAPFRNEGPDGYDTVEWLAAQGWCTGKVAMMGAHYAAWTQWAAARERPPHLAALVSTSPWSPGLQSSSGAISLPMLAWLHAMSAHVWQEAGQVDWERVLRHAPLRAADEAIGARLADWHAWLDSEPVASYWQHLDLTDADFAAIDVPVLHLTSWLEAAHETSLRYYAGMRAHSPAATEQALVVAGGSGEDFGDLHLKWFQRWLAADSPPAAPESRYFVTGVDEWHDGDWASVTDDTRTWFLHSKGGANTLDGDGALSPIEPSDEPHDSYVYDPAEPVIVSTDLTFFPSATRQLAPLPRDRRYVERRPDVLVYTSEELTEELTLNGNATLRLFARSDRPDTDWFVHLSDVSPSGASLLLATGGLRARHRDGLDRESFAPPGETYELSIGLSGVAHVAKPGHRLRLSVTGSCFPMFDRNFNTGGPIGHDEAPLVATNVVHHDSSRPSRLVLPTATGERA